MPAAGRSPDRLWRVPSVERISHYLLVQEEVIVELKAIEKLAPIHEAQLMTYLRLSGKKVGLLVNFNTLRLTNGIVRRVL